MALSRGRVAYAVVHSDPPEVFIAENDIVLTRVIALELIAKTSPIDFRDPARVDVLRAALLDERWSDALAEWIDLTGTVVDAYPDEPVRLDAELDEERVLLEMRVSPLFRDDVGG
jgi:hypothetical protein